jgi:hypothetical protein
MRRFFVFLVFFVVVQTLYARRHAAVVLSDDALQSAGMYTGIGSSRIKDNNIGEARGKAKQLALHDACASVFCSVSGETIQTQKESSSSLEDLFVSEVSIRTAVEAVNVKVLEQRNDNGVAFVKVGIPRDDLHKSYHLKISRALKQVSLDFELAENLRDKKPRRAIKAYERCMSGLEKLSDDLKVYVFLNSWTNDFEHSLEDVASRQQIEKRLAVLKGRTPRQPDELAAGLVAPLVVGMKNRRTFAIYPEEYENTGYVSDFGQNLTELIAHEIIKQTGWRRSDDSRKADYIFRGKIMTADKGMTLFLSMKSSGAEKSSELYVSEPTCKNISWSRIRPKDLDKALMDKVALYKSIKTDAGLRVQLQTDKMGDGPVVYKYGDRPKLVLKASQACYVRLIYVFSDGTKVLLLDNYRISNDMCNEWQRLPVNWEVCEPPGVEQMLVQATVNAKMPPLRIKRHHIAGGFYQDIILEKLDDAVVKTRGCKMFNSEVQLTEIPYQWTIFEK